MYGSSIGNLTILYQADGSKKVSELFRKNGGQGIYWQFGSIKLPQDTRNYRLMVVGTRGNGFHGDIGLDDFSFNDCSHVQRKLLVNRIMFIVEMGWKHGDRLINE